MATRCCTKKRCGAGRAKNGRIKRGYKLTKGGRLVKSSRRKRR